MRRKLVQLSPTTHVVSLPAKWLREHGLSKGDDLSLTEHEDGLIIAPPAKSGSGTVKLDLRDMADDERWAMIDAAYISGAQEIELRIDPAHAEYIIKAIRYFPGLVVTQQRTGVILASDIAGPEAIAAEQLMMRVHHMIVDMVRDGLDAYRSKDWKTLERIKYRDYVVSSYVSYFSRQLFREPQRTAREKSLLHTLVTLMEQIGDDAVVRLRDSVRKKDREEEIAQSLALVELCRTVLQKTGTEKKEALRALFRYARVEPTHAVLAQHAFGIYEVHLQLRMLEQAGKP